MNPGTLDFVIKLVACTLAGVVLMTYAAVLSLLVFYPSDDKAILGIIGHPLDNIVGAFIGIFGALKMVETLKDGKVKRVTDESVPPTSEGSGITRQQ